jgi:3-hydroxyacyl-[acyl-carrier-protein] dehydratase
MDNEILKHIPQRAPFLFIEKIVDRTENSVTTSLHLTGEEDFFNGHFPGNPVMPGVLLCEAVFQTGALLMSLKGESSQGKTAMVTRIQNTKFKNVVIPGQTITMTVELTEMLGPAAFMKGKVNLKDKTAMTVEFACTLVDQ